MKKILSLLLMTGLLLSPLAITQAFGEPTPRASLNSTKTQMHVRAHKAAKKHVVKHRVAKPVKKHALHK